jgi:cyanate permease
MWLPLILKAQHLNAMQIGLISVPPYVASAAGMMLWAQYVDRHRNRVLHLTLSCALAIVGLVASVVFAGLVPRLLALTVALLGVTSARTIFWTIPPRFLVGNAAAGGIAFINSVGILGGFFGPFLMGWLRELTGSFSAGLMMMAGVLLITTMASGSLGVLLKDGADRT